MEGGFLLDKGYGEKYPALWVEGPPEKSFWMGLRLRGRRQLTVYAWRCPRCSLLRCYAPES